MAQLDESTSPAPPSRGPLFYVGAGGLLTVMIIETLAVIGRHIGLPLLGALEIIQAAILLAACAAMVIATLANAHATVHLLVDRLPAPVKRAVVRFVALLSAVFFAGLTAGSIWLLTDFWHGHEVSEMLGIPFRPLRIVAALCTGVIAAAFAYRVLRSERA